MSSHSQKQSGQHDRFERLAQAQVERPLRVLSIVGVVTLIALALAARLQILTGFENLLPEARPSVEELRRVASRTGGVSTLFVVLEGNDTAALRKAADALVPPLVAIGPPWIGQGEDGPHDVVKFLEARAGLFADQKNLETLRDDVEARFDYEVGKETGTNLDLAGRDSAADRRRSRQEAARRERHRRGAISGRLLSKQRRQSAGRRPPLRRPRERSRARARGPRQGARGRRARGSREFRSHRTLGDTGDLAIGIGEYNAINRDLTDVGIAGACLILGVVFLYYLRLRTLVAMTMTIFSARLGRSD